MADSRPNFARSDRTRSELTTTLFGRLAGTSDPDERRRLLDEIVLVNLTVADALASRYAGRDTPLDDLEQVARLALVRATATFDPERGHDFLSYVVPSISGELRRYFRDHGWTIRPPRRVQEAQLRMNSVHGPLVQQLGREPRPDELAEALQTEEGTVVEAMAVNHCYHPDSLDRPVDSSHDGEQMLVERLGGRDPEFALCEARLMLRPLITQMAPRDRTVLHMRFVEGLTQREVGDRIGVTQMQVSRILQRVIDRLRDELGVATRA